MKRMVLVFASLIPLCVCAEKTYKVVLPESARKQLQLSNVNIGVEHNDIGFQLNFEYGGNLGPGNGGLVGAMMDSIKLAKPYSSAEQHAKDVRQMLGDSYLLEKLAEHVATELKSSTLAVGEITVREPEFGSTGAIYHFDTGVSLLLSVEFSFCSDLRALETTLTAHVIDRKTHVSVYSLTPRPGDENAKILYRNQLKYLSDQLPDEYMDNLLQMKHDATDKRDRKYIERDIARSDRPEQRAEAVASRLAIWQAHNGALLKKEIDVGLTGVMRLLVDDMAVSDQADTRSRDKKVIFFRDDERKEFRLNHPPFAGSVTSEPLAFLHAPTSQAVHCCAAEEAKQEQLRNPRRGR